MLFRPVRIRPALPKEVKMKKFNRDTSDGSPVQTFVVLRVDHDGSKDVNKQFTNWFKELPGNIISVRVIDAEHYARPELTETLEVRIPNWPQESVNKNSLKAKKHQILKDSLSCQWCGKTAKKKFGKTLHEKSCSKNPKNT